MNNFDLFCSKLFVYLFMSKRKKVTMTDSNEILKLEEKDREGLLHEIVRSEFDFAKNLARCLS